VILTPKHDTETTKLHLCSYVIVLSLILCHVKLSLQKLCIVSFWHVSENNRKHFSLVCLVHYINLHFTSYFTPQNYNEKYISSTSLATAASLQNHDKQKYKTCIFSHCNLCESSDWATHSFIGHLYEAHRYILNSHWLSTRKLRPIGLVNLKYIHRLIKILNIDQKCTQHGWKQT